MQSESGDPRIGHRESTAGFDLGGPATPRGIRLGYFSRSGCQEDEQLVDVAGSEPPKEDVAHLHKYDEREGDWFVALENLLDFICTGYVGNEADNGGGV